MAVVAQQALPVGLKFAQDTCDHSPVTSVEQFFKKYGYKSTSLVVMEFISRSPDFHQAGELAEVLGEMMADLESALINYRDTRPPVQ